MSDAHLDRLRAVVSKEEVVAALREACIEAGSQAKFSRSNRLHACDVSLALRGRRNLTPGMLAAVGCEIAYVRRDAV